MDSCHFDNKTCWKVPPWELGSYRFAKEPQTVPRWELNSYQLFVKETEKELNNYRFDSKLGSYYFESKLGSCYFDSKLGSCYFDSKLHFE